MKKRLTSRHVFFFDAFGVNHFRWSVDRDADFLQDQAARKVLRWDDIWCADIEWTGLDYCQRFISRYELKRAWGIVQLKRQSWQKLHNLFTIERGTGPEQINKNLPKEIKTTLGVSKYKKFQQTKYEKRLEIKEKQYEASQKEKKEKINGRLKRIHKKG